MAIVESVGKIPLQDPPEEEFCAADLTWTKFGNSEHHDEVPFIPYDRVDAFIIGECSNVECTTRFHIERGKKPTIGSLKDYKDDEYLEYRLYWCSFGPENYSVEPGWKVGGFLIDDTAAEIDLLSDVFCCPVLFSLWRVCRSWLRNIVKKCSNIEIQWEIFKRLGTIVYSIWGAINASLALEQFMLDFVDQTAFMEYFKVAWLPNLALQRVDWLVPKLTTELHSSCWLDWYADESDSFQNVKEKYIASTSWHRALQIPDYAVSLDDKAHLFAKVVSQKDSSLTHIVWNPGSEFASRGSSW
ncbi:hypothetical protein glysoja_007160 [Glycine soja]|nr:hypothetical protein glysoja_007160 [Glycine soja]